MFSTAQAMQYTCHATDYRPWLELSCCSSPHLLTELIQPLSPNCVRYGPPKQPAEAVAASRAQCADNCDQCKAAHAAVQRSRQQRQGHGARNGKALHDDVQHQQRHGHCFLRRCVFMQGSVLSAKRHISGNICVDRTPSTVPQQPHEVVCGDIY